MKTPELTIVIPCLNNLGIHDLIDDLYRLHSPEMFRIIVIDQTQDGLTFKHPVHLHIRTVKSLGWSKAVNIGWRLADTPYTLLANDDVRLLDPRWYEDLTQHFKDDAVLGANPFPALRTWDGSGTPTWYYDNNPEKFAWTKDKPFESYTKEEYDKLKKLLWGGCGGGTTYFFTMFKKEAKDIVGLIDEAYPINGSDYDHCRRIYLTCKNCKKPKHEHTCDNFEPYKVLTCTHSLVHHECGVSKANLAKNKELDGYQLVAKSKNIFHEKWGAGADIYGHVGLEKPNTPWCSIMPL
jgi:glycosyltransferase involved in cell wall biosynthesis